MTAQVKPSDHCNCFLNSNCFDVFGSDPVFRQVFLYGTYCTALLLSGSPTTKNQNSEPPPVWMKLDPEQTAKRQLTHLLRVDHFVLQVLCWGLGGGWGREARRLRLGGPGPGVCATRGLWLNKVVFFCFLLQMIGPVIFN